ncbi:MAG TPA: AAA family ATPase [Egibacteraceae bacterium]|nr:AAA family ATPase [Egibacteraceae bacterium]
MQGRPQEAAWDAGPGLFESVWRFRWKVLAAIIAAAVLAVGVSLLQTSRYEGVARLILSAPPDATVFSEAGPAVAVASPERHVRNQTQRVTSTAVLQLTAERIDGRLTLDDLRDAVTAEAATDLDMITIRARDRTPEEAAQLADAVALSYAQHVEDEVRARVAVALEEREERIGQLEGRIQSLDAALADGDNTALSARRDAAMSQLVAFQEEASRLELAAITYGDGVEQYEPAEIPESPIAPRPVRNAATAALLAGVAAAGVAWWRGEAAQVADGRHDPAAVLGAPLLGEVPDFQAVGVDGVAPAASAPHSAAAEAYGFVLASLDSAIESNGARSILITSTGPGDGKTTTAANLAVLARRDGRPVLLVDADERLRGLTQAAAMTTERGLTDLADPAVPVDWCISRWQISDNVTVPLVPAGVHVEHAGSFFRTASFRAALQRLRQSGSFLIIDCPPLLSVSDTSAVAGHVDGIVLVVNRGTPIQTLEEARERLDFVGTPLLGYVFNRTDPRRSRYGSYSYGQPSNGEASNGHPKGGKHVKRWRQKLSEPRKG